MLAAPQMNIIIEHSKQAPHKREQGGMRLQDAKQAAQTAASTASPLSGTAPIELRTYLCGILSKGAQSHRSFIAHQSLQTTC